MYAFILSPGGTAPEITFDRHDWFYDFGGATRKSPMDFLQGIGYGVGASTCLKKILRRENHGF